MARIRPCCLLLLAAAAGGAAAAQQQPPAPDLHAWACGSDPADMVIEGDLDQMHLGYSVALGDFDGDGRDELAFGTLTLAESEIGPGPPMVAKVYEYAPGTHPPFLDDVAAEQQKPELVITGLMPNPGGAITVAFVGDLDGDGREDLAVGAAWWELPGHVLEEDAGRVVIFLGKHWGVPPPVPGPWGKELLPLTVDASAADIILENSSLPRGRFGQALLGTDVNGDGFSDLLVGAPGCDDPDCARDTGRAFVFLGGPCGLAQMAQPCGSSLLETDAPGIADAVLVGEAAQDRLGWSLTDVGDLDGDGLPEVAVGAVQATFLSGALAKSPLAQTGPGEVRLWSPTNGSVSLLPAPEPPRLAHQGLFGLSVARLADLTGDGVPELAVGAPAFAYEGQLDRGAFSLFDGALCWVPGGSAPATAQLAGTEFMPGPDEAEDGAHFGCALSDAGADFDGDGRSDMYAAGWRFTEAQASAPCYGYPPPLTSAGDHAGRVLVVSTNPDSVPPYRVLARIGGEAGVPLSGESINDSGRLGYALATGNLDGDGLPDLLLSAFGLSNPDPTPPPWSDGGLELGRAYVLTGLHLQAVATHNTPTASGVTPTPQH